MIRETAPPAFPEVNSDNQEALERMAQVLAHRLRGLVASIEGFTDLLADTLSTRDQRELALRILEGAARIESVLSDLQLYSQSLQPVILPVRMKEVMSELLAPIDERSRERITCTISDDHGSIMVAADPFLLRQALLVLVQNALEATRNGGDVRVVAGIDEAAKAARFDVWNAGTIGVPNAEERVFMPFFTTKAHNLGVGLSIARRIARMHDGTIRLTENSESKGVCFSIHVPLTPEPVDL